MSNIKTDTVLRRVELPGSQIQDEMVFFDQNAGKYYATGPVGADIWTFLETPRSVEAIFGHLLSLYDIDRAICENEVLLFLDELLAAKMIEMANTD